MTFSIKRIILFQVMLAVLLPAGARIDRRAVVARHNPHVTKVDTLASLTVGNGRFAATVDATGLQTFPGFIQTAYR